MTPRSFRGRAPTPAVPSPYSVYDNATCASGDGGLITTLGPVTVANGTVPASPSWTATGTAGTYYFVASYSGDTDDHAAASGCGAEPITVTPKFPDDLHAAVGHECGRREYGLRHRSPFGCQRQCGGFCHLPRLRQRHVRQRRRRPHRNSRSLDGDQRERSQLSRCGRRPEPPERTTSWPPIRATPTTPPQRAGAVPSHHGHPRLHRPSPPSCQRRR